MTFRIEIKVKNAPLHRAIFAKHKSVADFCRAHGLPQSRVGEYLSLSLSPLLVSGEWSQTALEIAEALGELCDDLWPEHLQQRLEISKAACEMSLGEVAQLMDERNPEIALLGVERKEQVAKMLSKLTPREASILSRRFGIDDRGEMTQVEIADEEGVSKERIRQIEAKAMRKLRSFSRRDSQIAELVADACDDA